MARPDLSASPAARALAVVAVVGLALAVVALTVLALQRDTSLDPAAATPAPVPSFSFRGSDTPPPSATPSDAPPLPATSGAGERFLAQSSEGTLWRATAGACDGEEPLVERSDDAGQTWADVTPRYRGIERVRALYGFSGTEAEMVVDLAGCEAEWLRTFTQGNFWELYPELLEQATYPSLDAPAVLVTPGGDVPLPCPAPSSIRIGSQQTALVCDGVPQVRVGSAPWTPLPVDQVVAVDVLGRSTAVARVDPEACADGLALAWIDDDDAVTPAGCLDAADPAVPTAVAALDDILIVWSGDRVETFTR
ncbi:hypothetical protein [Microbacterium thalli]|uniref:hypothetical protein n=1 Tax=Microbacterium thalli TaxID=3027921 RepID=UPI002366AC9C|nr:hypothetical protein [Microbacterium thalli]MDD7930721.1 hypothetical protein [Microbacterium thalli]